MQTWQVISGDVREKLADLPDDSVQCIVTSPPYWGLRDYKHAEQLGLEPTPDAYIRTMVEVFQSAWRVLKDDGTCWLNLGDSYAGLGRERKESPGVGATQAMLAVDREVVWTPRDPGARDAKFRWILPGGIKPKDLVGIPWRVAFALQSDGWYLRSDVIWSKPNPMPESVTDRPTKAHEYVFLLTKSPKYYYDQDAIRVPYAECTLREFQDDYDGRATKDYEGTGAQDPSSVKSRIVKSARMGQRRAAAAGKAGSGNEANPNAVMPFLGGANARTVWTIPTQPYPDAHFATFPEELPTRCILAGSRLGDVVLDPFCGSGTTGAMALKLGRSFIGIELNPEYVELARRRIGATNSLFSREAIGIGQR